MRRKITGNLEEWLESGRSTCPIVLGARNVGKTYAVDEFLRSRFGSYLRIDFSEDAEAREAFDGSLDADSVLMALSLAFRELRIVPGDTALFFDNIQDCPRAMTALKPLAQDGRVKVIAAGTLVWLRMDEVPLIPAGYWERMHLEPMDFEEFLWAIGLQDSLIGEVRRRISEKEPLGGMLPSLMRYLCQYAIVGGMPEAVRSFAEKGTFEGMPEIHDSLIEAFMDDAERNAGERLDGRIRACFDSIPSILQKERKKFRFSDVEGGPGYRVGIGHYRKALEWLDSSFMTMESANLTELGFPLEAALKPTEFKVYFRDTGLLLSRYGEGIAMKVLGGDLGVCNGAVAENLVAGMLHVQGRRLMHYARWQDRTELDFVTSIDGTICAIEVKAGPSRSCAGLEKAIGEKVRGIMFETRDIFTDEKGIDHYPLFCAAFMDCIDRSRLPAVEPFDPGELEKFVGA